MWENLDLSNARWFMKDKAFMSCDYSFCFELYNVLRICLCVVVRHKDRRVVLHIHRGVKQQVVVAGPWVWRENAVSSSAILPHHHAAREHALNAISVWSCIYGTARIRRIFGKVDALAVKGCVLAAEGTVESLLNNFGDSVLVCAVPKPFSLDTVGNIRR